MDALKEFFFDGRLFWKEKDGMKERQRERER